VHQSSPVGAQKREEHGDLGSGLTRAQAVAWRPGDVAARRGHEKLGGEGFWRGGRRREGLGEVWGAPGVIGVAFIGPGEGTGGGGGRSNGGDE
jgi:hypothetical protein